MAGPFRPSPPRALCVRIGRGGAGCLKTFFGLVADLLPDPWACPKCTGTFDDAVKQFEVRPRAPRGARGSGEAPPGALRHCVPCRSSRRQGMCRPARPGVLFRVRRLGPIGGLRPSLVHAIV